MSKQIRLGAGSGFWGDALDPAVELLEKGSLDYLSMDYLAELTMALLQRAKMKNPDAGFVPDLVLHMRELLPLARKNGTKIICNGGGSNPHAAGLAIQKLAQELGLEGTRIAVVTGDGILDRLDDLVATGATLRNMDTHDTDFAAIRDKIVAANVYTGCEGIIEALAEGAHVVIAGRVSDNALYVGPVMHELSLEFGPENDDLIAAAITVGHVVECAGAATGGMSSRFDEMPDMGRVGFPIVEFGDDGTAVITKVDGSGGMVDQFTIKEHLVYEIGDPSQYLMPDGVADFTRLKIQETGKDRVTVSEMGGTGRPETLKLVVGYEDGWIGEGILFFPWPNALGRAEKAKQTLLERFDRLGLQADDIHFDYVGLNMLHGPASPPPNYDPAEIGLRVAVHTRTRDEAEKVRRACAQLWIMGPGGTSFGTPMKPRPVYGSWPTLIPRDFITQSVEILEA